MCVEGYDSEVVRWIVWRASWRRRGSLGGALKGGHVEFKVTVYWRLGGIRGGTGVRTVGVRGGTGEPYSGGAAGMHGGTGVSP